MNIEIQHVSKEFNHFAALHDVTLEIPSGKLVALLGPSGSGKTTLLRVIAGLESPDAGRVIFEGRDVTALTPAKRKVGFVFQQYALFRHMTVADNIAFGMSVRKRKDRPNADVIRARVEELLGLVRLEGLGNRRPNQISGGQRQRVALARALAVDPSVLLLDEPFGALDAKVRKELRHWLREFHDTLHITSLFVTHEQEEALELADVVVVLNHGKIEQIGTPREVYERPASEFVHEFLGEVDRVALGGQSIYVRPHEWVVAPVAEGPHELEGTVISMHDAGPVVRFKVLAQEQTVSVELAPRDYRRMQIVIGDSIGLRRESREEAVVHKS